MLRADKCKLRENVHPPRRPKRAWHLQGAVLLHRFPPDAFLREIRWIGEGWKSSSSGKSCDPSNEQGQTQLAYRTRDRTDPRWTALPESPSRTDQRSVWQNDAEVQLVVIEPVLLRTVYPCNHMRLPGGRLLAVERSLHLSIGSRFGSLYRHWVALVQIWLCQLLCQQVEPDRHYLCRDYGRSANNQMLPTCQFIHPNPQTPRRVDWWKGLWRVQKCFSAHDPAQLRRDDHINPQSFIAAPSVQKHWKSSLAYIHMHQINCWFPRILELVHSRDLLHLQNPRSQIRQSWRGRRVLKYRDVFPILASNDKKLDWWCYNSIVSDLGRCAEWVS